MKWSASSLVGIVLLGLGTAGLVGPAGAVEPAANDAALPSPVPGTAAEADGKPGAAQLAPGAPPAEPLDKRLAERGMKAGNPVLIRIFKDEAELELWLQAGERYELLATYPICNWSGTLGPKQAEGDKQSPEGLYAIGRRQIRHSKRWRRSLDLGYPNAFDRSHGRTGSYVLLHGGCTSTGCFAMTDTVMEEIFRLSQAALVRGQKRIQVHVFPFRMTAEKVAAHANSEWDGFWANLKEAYDQFEHSRLPPLVTVCDGRYLISEAGAGPVGCRGGKTIAGAPGLEPDRSAERTPPATRRRGRNARKAYAAARKMRLAARAKASPKAMGKAQAKASARQAAQQIGQRRLPR